MACEATNSVRGSALRIGLDNASRLLAPLEILVRAGDVKAHLYRVESGMVGLYDPRLGGEKALVESVLPGEFVGFGFLEAHTLTAAALEETHITCLPISMTSTIVANDPSAKARLADAIEREFDLRRESLTASGRDRPVERVAALLVNVSCSNSYEGLDPHILGDSWNCDAIADLIDLSVEHLIEILLDLESRNILVADKACGLRLIDIDVLEDLADGKGSVNGGSVRVNPPRLPSRWPVAA